MSELEWRDGDLPVSNRFDDPYYSRADGRLETSHVFIKGNQLHSRWPQMQNCTIAELGFGTGLNLLETVSQWKACRAENARLHFISFEQFPITSEEMRKANAPWPELDETSRALKNVWQTDNKLVNIEFMENIHLTVHFGDANTILPTLKFNADAWYLDGFSPAKNPELWNEALLKEVANHTNDNGTFATYTAAGFVRRGLQSAGFEVSKIKGFGTKRDMLVGKVSRDIDVANGP